MTRRHPLINLTWSSIFASSKLPIFSFHCSRAVCVCVCVCVSQNVLVCVCMTHNRQSCSIRIYITPCNNYVHVLRECVRAHVCVCVFECMHVCVCECLYVCVCLYTWSLSLPVLRPAFPSDRTPSGSCPEGVSPFNASTLSLSCLEEEHTQNKHNLCCTAYPDNSAT